MTSLEEKKNKRVGMIVSLTVHTLLLLLFAFLTAWQEPDPPLPEYGIVLNFGVDQSGTGEVQPETPVKQIKNKVEAEPEETQPEESPEEEPEPEVIGEPVVEEVTEVFEDNESEDVVEEKTEDTDVVEETIAKEEPVPVESEEKTEEEKVVPESDKGKENTPVTANQGDKTDETGDQGYVQGVIDERALYGKPGGGGGSSLELAGWIWDFKPEPNDTSNEIGRIVFEIKIDDQGEIISIKTLEKTVSPSVEKIYKAEVEKLTFSKTDNLPPAPISTGKITFIIKSR